MSIILTEFARVRLFPRTPRRNTIQDCTPESFERHLNEVAPLKVLDGYASFCKLHIHSNWTSTRCIALPITAENRNQLRSAYEARSSDELPVLVRWFEGVEPPVANYLIAILYANRRGLGCRRLPLHGRARRNADGADHDDAQCARRGAGWFGCAARSSSLPTQRCFLGCARELAGLVWLHSPPF